MTTDPVPHGSAAKALGGDEFSVQEALGGWRGFAESVIPGLVFVISYVVWGGYRIPVLAAVSAVALMVAVRLIQRTPTTQAWSGTVGVGIGAVWAWRTGEAGDYYLPGLFFAGGYAAVTAVSILIRRPLVGVAVALVKGWGSWWRDDPAAYRRMVWASWIFAIYQALKVAVQLPLYLVDAVAALGTARLLMGLPLFALCAWAMWLLVRNVAPAPEPADPPQQP